MRTNFLLVRVLVLLLALCAPLARATDAPPTGSVANDEQYLNQLFERSKLQIATPDARLHNLNVWIADDDSRRARGLMFIEHLDEDAGMLFLYAQPQTISMWMKNTRIALDMVFVRADGRVESVVANTEPMSLKTIRSKGAVVAVIELNAGSAARMKIGPGAQVIHSAFPH
jgi:uncharacterized membrane protein (UPF0127 family)